MDRWIDRSMGWCMEGWIVGWMDGWMAGWMDGWIGLDWIGLDWMGGSNPQIARSIDWNECWEKHCSYRPWNSKINKILKRSRTWIFKKSKNIQKTFENIGFPCISGKKSIVFWIFFWIFWKFRFLIFFWIFLNSKFLNQNRTPTMEYWFIFCEAELVFFWLL